MDSFEGKKQKNNNKVKLLLMVIAAIGLMGAASWGILQALGGGRKPVTSETRQNTPTVPINLANSANLESPPTFADVPKVPNGLFSNGGSTTWAFIRGATTQPITTAWPNFRLRYTELPKGAPGSGIGIQMLLNDQLSFAQSSRSLTVEEYQNAVERGFKLKQVPIAIDGLAIAVNPDLNVKGITLTQLKEIYTGKITNWKSLGGPNLSITPYSRELGTGGTIEFFQDNILQGQALSDRVKFVRDTTQGLRRINQDLGGIYYASASAIVPQCSVKTLAVGRTLTNLIPAYKAPFIPESQCPAQRNQINREDFKTGKYPITRRLFVIVKENGQLDEQAGNAYLNLLLTNQGQDLIEQAGFVKIR